jgi:DNA replication protein DnaD
MTFHYSVQNAELICTSSKQSLEIIVFIMEKAKVIHDSKTEEIADEVGKSSSTTNKETSNGAKKKPQKSTKSSA